MSRSRLNTVAANARRITLVIGASAVVAMGAASVAVAQHAPQTPLIGAGSQTTTSSVPPSAPLISSAAPVVKATFFGKG
ncbi:hypothetical protein FZI85_08275 [Mycobacterium sp. CBMA293]|uniref:hypothetical protein n=1 Tax=unclassified Mycolicibacterium TaxID=2636767 RepID=UPI0012DDAF6E|nr:MULTISPECIES: hypothetical protein [unclassified Mycolicibacterium]MUL63871.1 hypothetical protein [Mycolicibacterium sp. CBMA 234]MUL46407.1 hypothetical protein [Mycolicibacterium sp. CBMA 360]MUL57081.1 hypothetical protein [Mycolicibacterium sp. CBMA 335]MUL70121.1 hypothetical protein [Mycolicibacterium sp. CBMA 311]MUL92169.1 hypothetical protein [Mycolicibacterium sp. CBMA 230]